MDVFIHERFRQAIFTAAQPKKRRSCATFSRLSNEYFPCKTRLQQEYEVRNPPILCTKHILKRPTSNYFFMIINISWALLVGVFGVLPSGVHRSKKEISRSKFDCYERDDLKTKWKNKTSSFQRVFFLSVGKNYFWKPIYDITVFSPMKIIVLIKVTLK